jgi:RNA polymerase sigma factor (sigma-70 family)
MGEEPTASAHRQTVRNRQQSEPLQQKQAKLERLVDTQSKKEFFKEIIPLLNPLRAYIKRRLRLAYLGGQIRTPVYTSGDLLDEVVLQAYEHYDQKPASLSLEEWLYRLTNQRLENYFSKRTSAEKRRRSLEALTQAELRTLEEMPITADADGEVWFPDELDDSEYDKRDFYPPSYMSDPEEQLERQEEVRRIVHALAHVPERDRMVFELFAVEGFSKDAIATISNVSPEDVTPIVDRVRTQVLREIESSRAEIIDREHKQAS